MTSMTDTLTTAPPSRISYKVGNVMMAEERAIAHGCNCQGVMGAGVARLVKKWHPTVFAAYKRACDAGEFQVGTAQGVWTDPAVDGQDRMVYNLGTQHFPGPDATSWGIFLSFANLAENTLRRGITAVAIPRIGAGIGALDWDNDVAPYIERAIVLSRNKTLSIVVYDLPEGA